MIRIILPADVPTAARRRQLGKAIGRLHRDQRRRAEAIRTGDLECFRNANNRIKRDADMVAAWRAVQQTGAVA